MAENRPSWGRAVITGGAGFLGSHLCRSLLAAGTEVVCVDDFPTGRPENAAGPVRARGFTLRQADVAA